METYRTVMELIGLALEIAGAAVIVGGALYAGWRYALARHPDGRRSYAALRRDVGLSILLGLEFLIAGDIIRSIAIPPSLESVSVLGLIVVIRTFLSFALHVEMEGCWPWELRRRRADGESNAA